MKQKFHVNLSTQPIPKEDWEKETPLDYNNVQDWDVYSFRDWLY